MPFSVPVLHRFASNTFDLLPVILQERQECVDRCGLRALTQWLWEERLENLLGMAIASRSVSSVFATKSIVTSYEGQKASTRGEDLRKRTYLGLILA